VGHITLGIEDIELVADAFESALELDDSDFVLIEERPSSRADTGPQRVVQMPQPRRSTRRAPSFDDMPTVVRAIDRVASGRR
jgi:hypothetical protein